MCLISIDEFLETAFSEKSRPTRRTLIRQIQKKLLPGKKIGRTYFIDAKLYAQLTGDPLVDRVLLKQHD